MSALRPTPEQIPDVDLSNYILVGSDQNRKWRAEEHEGMSRERRCHAFGGLEYHYCGRTEGRLFPIAKEPRPVPTLPNPMVSMKTGRPLPPPRPAPDIKISTNVAGFGGESLWWQLSPLWAPIVCLLVLSPLLAWSIHLLGPFLAELGQLYLTLWPAEYQHP